jgi:proteasome lid subunit RPN8/RPN11
MNILRSGLILAPDHWAQMEADVASRLNEEACGLVAGIDNQSKTVISVTNILHAPHRFRMDPQEELNAFWLAEQNGWDILAIYHSHPHGIWNPSPTDLAELTFPEVIYLIWYQEDVTWHCRGYLMHTYLDPEEVPVTISTNR